MKKFILLLLLLILQLNLFAQKKPSIKTNLLNLVAQGPSAAIELPLNDKSLMYSYDSGKIDFGDVGGLMKYRTSTLELRKHIYEFYYGVYLKYIDKKVERTEVYFDGTIPFTMGKNRYFTGNGFSTGGTIGFELYAWKKLNFDFNFQLGYGRYFYMKEVFPENYPSGNFLDTRLAAWIGYRL